MTRFLQSTLRTVARDIEEYRATWGQVREAATAVNVRAWIFRAADSPHQFIEFLEWSAPGENAVLLPHLHEQLKKLDRFGSGITQQWLDP